MILPKPALLFLPFFLAGCVGMPPSTLPADSPYMVTVKTVRLRGDAAQGSSLAYYTWFDVKEQDAWERIEFPSDYRRPIIVGITNADAHENERWGHTVSVVGMIKSNDSQIVDQLKAYTLDYDGGEYNGWPGPNANTFAMGAARAVPGLNFPFFHNAFGKDYTSVIYAGPSSTGSGFQIDTWPIGLQAGLADGLQVHFLQMTLGISVFPPGLDLPLLPRIGLPPRPD